MLASRYFVPPPRKVRGKSFAEVSLKKVFRHKSLARAPSKTRKVEQIKVRRASTVSLYSSENSCVSPYPSAPARRNRKKIANKLPLKSERAISTPFFPWESISLLSRRRVHTSRVSAGEKSFSLSMLEAEYSMLLYTPRRQRLGGGGGGGRVAESNLSSFLLAFWQQQRQKRTQNFCSVATVRPFVRSSGQWDPATQFENG